MPALPILFWLAALFILGSAIGSFLNVCIDRLPLQKSVLWPGSRCGSCLQPIKGYDNIPLVSFWLLRGRCRHCGAAFSGRCFVVELLTALGFAALFYLLVVLNVRKFPVLEQNQWQIAAGVIPWEGWVIYVHHVLLFCFLLAAAFCDFAHQEIPLAITVPGTLVGLVASALWPWPWPNTLPVAMAGFKSEAWWVNFQAGPRAGLYPWPVWGPWPGWLPPGTWYSGLAVGLAGMLAGSMMLRAIGFLFLHGMGREAVVKSMKGAGKHDKVEEEELEGASALGLGDADLMMMAGAFLGWQAVVVAFFVSVFPGLFVGVFQMIFARGRAFAFGPSLAIGVLLTALGWDWLRPRAQLFFFWPEILIPSVAMAAMFLFAAALVLRKLRS